MKNCGYRLLPHTADMGLEVWGQSPEELFAVAGEGLKEIVFGNTSVATNRQLQVHLTADNQAELLAVWLNELLYQLEVNNLVPAKFRICRLTVRELEAVILGESYAPARHPMERQVKAATYHQLMMTRGAEGWFARLYLDL